jgi:adenosylcobinamide-GDP ribazoletransferase
MGKWAFWLEQLRLFVIAVGFFTRIPLLRRTSPDNDTINRASRYYGLVGTLVGGLSALVLWLLSFYLPLSVAIVLSMITSVWLTGGFDEHGLAVTADSFGAGDSAGQKLQMMKERRLGSYGVLALVLVLLLKFELLMELALYDPTLTALALVLGHTLSRVTAASLIFGETCVHEEGLNRHPVQRQSINELSFLLVTGLIVMLLFSRGQLIPLVVGLLLLRFILARWFRHQIDGYTGDTLGAGQQLAEVLVYIIVLAGWNAATRS